MAPFACICVPNFPLEALLRAEPELRAQPVAALEGKAPLQKICAVNALARQAGIEPGMTRVQVEVCSNLALRARSSVQESAARAALLDCAQSFSPCVEEKEPGTVLLDLAGSEVLLGPSSKIAHDLVCRASALGLEANAAVAANPDAARLAAQGFPGVTVIAAGKEVEQLGSLPVEVLAADCPDETETLFETLHRWGIRNLGDLAALPEVALSARLGQRGLHLRRLARGQVSRKLVPADPPLIFEEAVELEYPLMLLEPLAFLLSRMIEQLCARLEAQALATQELKLRLELENGWKIGDEGTAELGSAGRAGQAPPPHDLSRRFFCRTLRLPVPLVDARVFLKLLQLDLRAHPPGAPIVKIHLTAEPARPRAAQGGLFLPPSPEPEKLELTLARIAGIVGEDKSGAVELLDTHRPEGFRMRRFAPDAPKGKSAPQKEDRELVTALRLFRPPVHATVTIQDGRPAHIRTRRKQVQEGEVLWAAGPWRSTGDWWEHDGWARDEWDIAVQTDSEILLYRLVRDLLSGSWSVEGTYD